MDTDMKTLKTTLAIAALILSSASASSAHAGLFEDIADVIEEARVRVPADVTGCFDCYPDLMPDVLAPETPLSAGSGIDVQGESTSLPAQKQSQSSMGNVFPTQFGRSAPGPHQLVGSPCYTWDPSGRQVWGTVGL